MRNSTVEFETHILLVDTAEKCDEPQVKVTATYTPEEPMVRYYADGSGHPGSPDEVEVTKVVRADTGEELEFDSLPESCREQLEEAVRDNVAGRSCDEGPEPEDRELPERVAEREEHFSDVRNDR